MNFMLHYKGWLRKVVDDERLTAHHVSLYLALLETWNLSRFKNPITIYRAEVMRICKIGSRTTYLRCLKDLTEWRYIRYKPSFNAQRGSQVHLFKFGTAGGTTRSTGGDTAAGTGNGTIRGTTGRPIYKTIQNIKNVKNIQNDENAYGTSQDHSDFRKTKPDPSRVDDVRAIPTSVAEAQTYFLELHSTADEAEKFFNHFQSKGWKVGGRAPMCDWRASARNWVINAKNFTHDTARHKPGKLYTGPKNYSEPL